MKLVNLAIVAFGLAILASLVLYADPSRLWPILESARMDYMLAALALATLTFPLLALKWWVLVRRASARRLFPIQLLGIAFSHLTPGKVGEPAKALILKARTGLNVSETFPSIVWERIIDIIVLLLLAMTAFAFLSLQGNLLVASLLGLLAFGILTLLALAVLYSEGLGSRLFRFGKKLPLLRTMPESFLEAFYRERVSAGGLAACFLITLLSWLLDALVYWLAFASIGISLDIALVPGIMALAVVVGIASSLPGGLGTSEVVLTALLGLVGVPVTTAVAGVLLGRLLTFWYLMFAGGISFLYLVKGTGLDLFALSSYRDDRNSKRQVA